MAFKKQFGTILKLFWFLLKNERVTLAKALWEGITQGLSFLLDVGEIQYNFLVATGQNQKEGSSKLKTSKHTGPHPPPAPGPLATSPRISGNYFYWGKKELVSQIIYICYPL